MLLCLFKKIIIIWILLYIYLKQTDINILYESLVYLYFFLLATYFFGKGYILLLIYEVQNIMDNFEHLLLIRQLYYQEYGAVIVTLRNNPLL